MKVLVVDDDPKILSLLKKYLSANGHAVVTAADGADGLLLARDAAPDLVLLDAQLPGLDGYELTRVLRRGEPSRGVPIILMSGSFTSDKDVLHGLEGGADDYILKPFSLAVLAARMEAVRRRYGAAPSPGERMRRGGIELDGAGRTVKVGGAPVALTRKEFDLLALLMAKAGRVLSVPYLLETVWGYDPADYNDPATVEVHVSHLRKKLGPAAAASLVNVVGHGYKFEA